ncbi:lysophospholipid acyltransferase family protein [Anaeromyxobacter sp. SG26]|uniref:lysophospholipid acyltransferase family protein n=1 Tax=Anaeromyxobacter sp. SG26 TaxID=2925407 RepID=UPI001F586399|nr:lysophospholipid acyltransferase family protein [Anaeromyxobacter sp. SG26]
MTVPLRKRIKRSVRSAIVRAAIRLLSLLPLSVALALGGALGRLGYLLAGKTRRLALRHLALAFPERSEAEREAIARRMFVHLGRAAMEVVTIRSYDARLETYVELSNGEVLREVMARGKGMMFVTGHVGNWELLARRIARAGVPNAVIAKAGHDPRLNALAEEFRASGGVTTLWRENPETGRAIIRTFRQGRALGLLIDQDTDVQGVHVPFFGRLAYTPRAAADLALRFGAPVVVGTIRRRGPRAGDGHLLEVVEIPYDPSAQDREAEAVRLTAACSLALETAIRRSPEEWVWMHERWKTRPPAEAGSPQQASTMPKSSELSGA